MSQSTDIVNAEIAGLYVNNVKIAHITNVVLTIDNELRQIAGNTSVKEFIYGRDSWSVQSEGFVAFQSGYNWDYLMAMLDQYQYLTIKIPTNANNNEYIVGIALLQTNTLTAGNTGEMIKMSLSFQGTGPLQRVFASYPLNCTPPETTIDGAGCATSYPNTYYFNNQSSYPFAQVGDTIYTDAALTTALTGNANKYIGIQNQYGTAYQIDTNGEIIAKEISTCGGQTF